MSGLEVGISTNSKNGKYALSVNPLKNESWLRFPIYTGGKTRKFVFKFWAKTEFDIETKDSVSFYLHISTPGFFGTGSDFLRIESFSILDQTKGVNFL